MKLLFSICIVILSVMVTLSCRQEDATPATVSSAVRSQSSVWKVEKDGRKLYLAGTIHLLRKKDYPLPPVYDQAYEDSQRVVFELPPDSDKSSDIALRMKELGSYQPGDQLSKHVSPETMLKVEAWSRSSGTPLILAQSMRPWFLALTVAAVEYQKMGAESGMGVDNHFSARAKQDRKPGSGLETVEFQLGLFAGLSEQMQEELLQQTFSEAETVKHDFEQLIQAWREGDLDKIYAILYRDADKYPELMEGFLVKRNQAWVKPLLEILQHGDTAMVLVGTGHLCGEHGLIKLLEKEGCTITQLQ